MLVMIKSNPSYQSTFSLFPGPRMQDQRPINPAQPVQLRAQVTFYLLAYAIPPEVQKHTASRDCYAVLFLPNTAVPGQTGGFFL
jgi:hypothetical protein